MDDTGQTTKEVTTVEMHKAAVERTTNSNRQNSVFASVYYKVRKRVNLSTQKTKVINMMGLQRMRVLVIEILFILK